MKIAYNEDLLKDKIREHYQNYHYDFSNYYFPKNMWKKDYLKKYDSLPEEYERSNSRKVPVWINAVTKEEFPVLPTNGEEIDLHPYHENYYQLKYVEDLNCIVIMDWSVNTKLHYIEKNTFYYVDEKKTLWECSKGLVSKLEYPKYYSKDIENICRGRALENVRQMFFNAFDPIFPIAFSGSNNYMFVRDGYTLRCFLEQKEVVKKNGPKQKKINELCEFELKQPESMNYDMGNNRRFAWSKERVSVVASKVNDEYSVLRWFQKDPVNKKAYETARLFVSKKDVEFCRINSFGEFVQINGKLNPNNFDAYEFIVESEDAFDGTKLSYFKECLSELKDDKHKIKLLWLFTYYPIAEKMWKSTDCRWFVYNYITKIYCMKFPDKLEDFFGYVDHNAKSLNKALGMNNYQLKKMNEEENKEARFRFSGCIEKVQLLKQSLGMTDLSSLDNKTYDALYDLADLFKDNPYNCGCRFFLRNLCSHFSYSSIIRIADDFRKIKPSSHVVTLYGDYIDMIIKLGDATNFKPYFKSVDDIIKMHDAAAAIYNLKKDEAKAHAFEEHLKRWKMWEYDKNDKFTVVAPTKPGDLAREGIMLHHCVKSYIDRVADGYTNIMFIRKNTDLDIPFFTVEVSNQSTIEQVHGFGNCNADSEPGLEDFIKEWAKARKLKSHGYDKVR